MFYVYQVEHWKNVEHVATVTNLILIIISVPSHVLDKYFFANHLHPYNNYLLSASKRKGGQVRFTPQQTQILEKRFSSHKYLSPEERRNLARQLRLSDRQVCNFTNCYFVNRLILIFLIYFFLQVKTWFQNRRAKYRRIISGPSTSQNKTTNSSNSLLNYRHISDYHHISHPLSLNIRNCNNSPKSSSSSLDLRMHVNDINVDGDDDEDTDAVDILDRKHMDDMLQQTTRWIKWFFSVLNRGDAMCK